MQGDSMEMGGDPTKGIWWVKEKICWRTNFGSHQLHMSLTHGVRHFRFCNRSHIIYAMWGWKVAPMCISIQRSKRCWEELWCAWQGNAGDNTSTRDMETLFGGGKAWNRYMDWSSKSQILYDCQKIKLFLSLLVDTLKNASMVQTHVHAFSYANVDKLCWRNCTSIFINGDSIWPISPHAIHQCATYSWTVIS